MDIIEEVLNEVLQDDELVFIVPTYNVYVQVDENNVIIRVDSEWNINDTTEWILVESDVEEQRGHHAQSSYLPKGLFDELGRYNYKLVDGEVVGLTDEEKATLFPPIEPQPSLEERLTIVEETNETQGSSIDDLQTQLDDFIFSQLFGDEEII